jgi:hypothetical protein
MKERQPVNHNHHLRLTKPAPYLILILLVYIAAFITLGEYLKSRAYTQWYQMAYRETQNLTTTSLNLLSNIQIQLKGIALLFHASEKVTENEFLDAIEYYENKNLASSVTSWGVVQHLPIDQYKIIKSSDRIGDFATDEAFDKYLATKIIAEQCLNLPDKIVVSNSIPPVDNPLIVFAISIPYNGEIATLFMALNIQEHFNDLKTLYSPEGLSFRLYKNSINSLAEDKVKLLVNDDRNSQPILRTFEFETETNGIHWKF